MSSIPASPSRWQSLRLNPFRLFFPLGIVAGCVGVGAWALWTTGISVPDIKRLHVVFQSQGFMLFFVMGFLMTALPRFSGTTPASLGEIFSTFFGASLFFVAALSRQFVWAHIGTLIMVAVMLVFGARRFPKRTKEPPPSFVLIGFGLVHLIVGTVLSILAETRESSAVLYGLGRQMVQLGFLTCMVLGITAKLAPFLMGYTDEPACEEGGQLCRMMGGHQFLVHGLIGALIFLSFIVEIWFPPFSSGLRAFLVLLHMLLFAKIGRLIRKRTITILLFWMSCWMLPLGYAVAFAFPSYRVAALHIIFVGGFSLMIFSFGFLVVLSHSQRAVLLNGKLWTLKAVGVLMGLALVFRVAADFVPSKYMLFLHNASGFWVVAAILWIFYLIPKMRGVEHQH